MGCSPWGQEGSDATERLHFHFSLSCIGQGNGNPLQCSCLENPREGGAWWAAVYGAAQIRTRVKRQQQQEQQPKDDSFNPTPPRQGDGFRSCVTVEMMKPEDGAVLTSKTFQS